MPRLGSTLLLTLREPNYGRYAAGNAVSLVGTWVQRVAVGWLTWELTGSGTWLGIVALADLAPALVFGPLGGAIADRRPPLRIALIGQTLAMIQALVLCILTLLGHVSPGLLAGLVFVGGAIMGFVQPARLSLVHSLVPRERLATAVALNSVVFNAARFVGPAFAGVILVWQGPALAFGLNALSFVAVIAALATLRLEPPDAGAAADGDARVPREASSSMLADMRAGAGYALADAFIGPLLTYYAVVSIAVRSYMELLPGFAGAVLGGGAAELAMLSSAAGLGAVAAGAWVGERGAAAARAGFVVACGAGSALAVLGLACSTHIVPAVACAAAAGAATVMGGISAQTAVQLNVRSEYRARVLSLYGVVTRAGPAIGALLMGVASEWLGLQWPLAAGACVVLALWSWFRPRARRMDRDRADRQRRSSAGPE